MKKNILIGVLSATCLALASAGASAAGVKEYKTEAGAQKHCPKDLVVWGSSASGVYHLKGTRNYGTTKDGHYVCAAEANAAGWHAAKNNQ